jgi:hypothetical protein
MINFITPHQLISPTDRPQMNYDSDYMKDGDEEAAKKEGK